ncbi:MAG: lycopene cyclase domain-containing protein [Flavobacterium psychrophilum]|nr:MAG: lycopene cyclase domain-containing protein [Flavobacterium psychrophilum]
MKPYTYLLINFLTIVVCFIFSFHPKIRFDKYFGAFIKTSVMVAMPFLIWDAWFTHAGVWWFSKEYTVGINLVGMPVEEWLFFICIPFSCVFTYFCLIKFFDLGWVERYTKLIVFMVLAISIAVLFAFYGRMYTTLTAVVTIVAIVYLYFIARYGSLGRSTLIYLILMFGFIPVNGTLTGTGLESPVVNYNPDEIIGLRILTIPIEDFAYGYVLFLMNVYIFEFITKSSVSPETINANVVD